jgi:hypothetical protein
MFLCNLLLLYTSISANTQKQHYIIEEVGSDKLILVGLLIAAMVFNVAVVFADGHGPASNSGDGIPDGSGFDFQNGPNN